MIEQERERQDKLHPLPSKKKPDDPETRAVYNMMLNGEFLAVLVEEVGEVGKALQGDGILEDELIQVAATVTRWMENIK